MLSHLVLVVATHADQGKGVCDQLSFDLFVKHAGATQRGKAVNFKHPWLQVLVKHYVEAVDFKATLLPVSGFVHFFHDVGLDADQGFYYTVLNP